MRIRLQLKITKEIRSINTQNMLNPNRFLIPNITQAIVNPTYDDQKNAAST